MTVKKTVKQKTQSSFKIGIVHTTVFPTREAAMAAKVRIAGKVKQAKFSTITKTTRGYKMFVRTAYAQKFPSGTSSSAIKSYYSQQCPGAKVTVTKA